MLGNAVDDANKDIKDDEITKDTNGGATALAAIEKSNADLKNLQFRVVQYKCVPHPSVRAMSYVNPMLGTMMGM